MRMRLPRLVFALAFAALVMANLWAVQAQPAAPQASPAAVDFFESNVRPVLAESCFRCHTDRETAGLRVDSREALLKGGDSGPAIVPGNPDASLLIKAIRHAADVPRMPMGGAKLSEQAIAALAQWIRDGAIWPQPTGASAAAAAPRLAEKTITPEQRAFWSFQPIRRVVPPPVTDRGWVKSDIDRFILARLEKEGLQPVRAADRRTLIRRATLDLTGLPPTPEEVDAFEQDQSPEAFA